MVLTSRRHRMEEDFEGFGLCNLIGREVIMMSLSSPPMSSLLPMNLQNNYHFTNLPCLLLNRWVWMRNDAIMITVQCTIPIVIHRTEMLPASEEPSKTSSFDFDGWTCCRREIASMHFQLLSYFSVLIQLWQWFLWMLLRWFPVIVIDYALPIDSEFTHPIERMILSECSIKQFQPCA